MIDAIASNRAAVMAVQPDFNSNDRAIYPAELLAHAASESWCYPAHHAALWWGVEGSIIKSAGEMAPPVASAIFTDNGNDGWRWPYTIFRIVVSASSRRSANCRTLSPDDLR